MEVANGGNTTENFVTVVSVGPPQSEEANNSSGYVTILTIGEQPTKDVTEEVLVYRLPGERLGFGLKFEGGTKANEFVKRLFIQSCAPDSPASRVQSSWGSLTEGDEVLEIDSIPVNSMTRIECVRCLKDSNVVIKLLVRHSTTANERGQVEARTRSVEDLPQVISAEKKRVPPPPPPVPPRKIPKKYAKNKELQQQQQQQQENPVPAIRHSVNSDGTGKNKFQSPRSSGRQVSQSPEVPRRDRRLSDGSLGPPDAEVYVDLFSQESTLSLSESDDTGSSISTVVDRFASFPTTTTSSLAGSLPSTPTSLQKHLDFSSLYEDEEIVASTNRNVLKPVNGYVNNKSEINEKVENEKPFTTTIINEDGVPLQPPSCFQDAPLSYGNEDMKTIDTSLDEIDIRKITLICDKKLVTKPPIPPSSKEYLANKEFHDENMNISSLPRLVDFVPKSTTKDTFDIEAIEVFLENERREIDLNNYQIDDNKNIYDNNNDVDLYSSKWTQLDTIGEVEEETNQESINRSPVSSTPIVIVENADFDAATVDGEDLKIAGNNSHSTFNGKMETLPSDSRQPPDGHEFPDYIETNSDQVNFTSQTTYNFTKTEPNQDRSPTIKTYTQPNRSSFHEFPSVPIQNSKPLNKINSVSNSDLSCIFAKHELENDLVVSEPKLHTRSQSLIDMSSISKQKSDRWSLLAEQRKKGLSKLKGLVIPEHVSENELAQAVNIPEIVSHTTPTFMVDTRMKHCENNKKCHTDVIEPVVLPLTSPPWSSSSSNTLPKYSPAFKRKSLQVYPANNLIKKFDNTEDNGSNEIISTANCKIDKPNSNIIKSKIDGDEFRLDNLSDAPKSLESITSPTRSDCSFDYVANSFKIKINKPEILTNKFYKEQPSYVSKLHKDLGKSEDESDNDSAVSSSQSSYISRCSPPPSPTRSCELLDYDSIESKNQLQEIQCRLLKPSSVEAINRKNILASAKCRSGRDLKVGSPVIQRKYDENGDNNGDIVDAPTLVKQESEPGSVPNRPYVEKRSFSYEEFSKAAVTPTADKEPILALSKLSETSNSSAVFDLPRRTSITSKEINNSKILEKIEPRPSLFSSRNNTKSMSVTDLRKNFEKMETTPTTTIITTPSTLTVATTQPQQNQVISKAIKSIESSTLHQRRSEPVQKIKEPDNKPKAAALTSVTTDKSAKKGTEVGCRKIVLCPKFFGGSIGVTLAGGTDYETKEITVHKIRYGSVAYHDGSLKRGDRILSINGKSTVGLTHAESVDLLKEPVDEFILEVEDGKEEPVKSPQRKSFIYETPERKSPGAVPVRSPTHAVKLIKDGAGLGFSIEGGKDSSQGDLPLRVKKIFQGGAAEKNGELFVGDELLIINDIEIINMTKIEVWSLMKKLPDGHVSIHIHR